MCNIKSLKDNQIILFGIIIALGAILSTTIFTKGIVKFQKLQNQTIQVTGSASENVKSDFAIMTISYKETSKDLKTGYRKIDFDSKKVEEFLLKNAIEKDNIDYTSTSHYEVFKREGNYTTNQVDYYRLQKDVKISSKDINKIIAISKKINELVESDIEIGYTSIEYFVSDIDSIKIKMVGEATKNAKQRAESIVKATGDKIGSLNSAKMGVFQIVPANSTEVSDMGINDTNSIEKKVVAVVNATFTVK